MARGSKYRFALRAGFSLGLFVATSCSTAFVNWYNTRRVPGYVVPARIPLVVDVSERAHQADQGGYVDTMVLTVFEELGDRGSDFGTADPRDLAETAGDAIAEALTDPESTARKPPGAGGPGGR